MSLLLFLCGSSEYLSNRSTESMREVETTHCASDVGRLVRPPGRSFSGDQANISDNNQNYHCGQGLLAAGTVNSLSILPQHQCDSHLYVACSPKDVLYIGRRRPSSTHKHRSYSSENRSPESRPPSHRTASFPSRAIGPNFKKLSFLFTLDVISHKINLWC